MSSCHIGAYSRHIKEYTNDYIPYIEARLGQWTIKYSFMYRSFNSGDDVPRHLYLNAQGPTPVPPSYPDAAFKPTFGDASGQFPGQGQVNFDYSDGELPFARTPDSEKWQHTVKAKWDISPYQSLDLGFVYSEAQNEDSDEGDGGNGALYGDFGKELETDYTAFTGRWHFRFRKDMALTVKAKYHSMDGDDVFVDLPRVYNSWKDPDVDGTNFDFERKSAYDEDEFIFGADLSWRYSKSLKFRFAYELEYTDRNNAEEHHVTEDTTEHQFKLAATWKPRLGLKVKALWTILTPSSMPSAPNLQIPELIIRPLAKNLGIATLFMADGRERPLINQNTSTISVSRLTISLMLKPMPISISPIFMPKITTQISTTGKEIPSMWGLTLPLCLPQKWV